MEGRNLKMGNLKGIMENSLLSDAESGMDFPLSNRYRPFFLTKKHNAHKEHCLVTVR